MAKKQKASALGIMDVARLIGIQPTLLNKFMQRGKYGMVASVRPGERQGKHRLFSDSDLFGIALVYWLFEAGLRSESIQFVLNQMCGGQRGSSGNDAAAKVRRSTDVLVITREPRRWFAKHPAQTTRLVDIEEAAQLVRENATNSIMTIPIGSMLAELKKRWEATDGNL